MDSSLIQQGEYLLQVVYGFRVGVPDGDGLSALTGQFEQLVELLIDGRQGAFVVQKDVASGVGNAGLARLKQRH